MLYPYEILIQYAADEGVCQPRECSRRGRLPATGISRQKWIPDQVGDDIITYHHEISFGLKVCGILSFLGITLAAMPNLPDSVQVTSLVKV